jgi:hypothetical protein
MISEERLLKVRKILTCVDDPQKKPITGDKIEPLGFQKVGLKSGELWVMWFGYFIAPSGTGKFLFQHVLLHPKG